jgi:hypothetical protein
MTIPCFLVAVRKDPADAVVERAPVATSLTRRGARLRLRTQGASAKGLQFHERALGLSPSGHNRS